MKKLLTGFLSVLIGAFSLSAAAGDGDIAADEAYAASKRGELLIVDVRTPTEWRETGIPEGAKTAEFGSSAFVATVSAVVGPDNAKPIAVICRSGNRSTKAAAILSAAGFTNVLNIREGMAGSGAGPGWLRRGLQTISCPQC